MYILYFALKIEPVLISCVGRFLVLALVALRALRYAGNLLSSFPAGGVSVWLLIYLSIMTTPIFVKINK